MAVPVEDTPVGEVGRHKNKGQCWFQNRKELARQQQRSSEECGDNCAPYPPPGNQDSEVLPLSPRSLFLQKCLVVRTPLYYGRRNVPIFAFCVTPRIHLASELIARFSGHSLCARYGLNVLRELLSLLLSQLP